jgi:uncharacterized protein YydD (DUF2326 family)
MKKGQKDTRTITQQSLGRSEEITKETQKKRWLDWGYSYLRLVDFDTEKYDEFKEWVGSRSDEIFEEVYERQNKEVS